MALCSFYDLSGKIINLNHIQKVVKSSDSDNYYIQFSKDHFLDISSEDYEKLKAVLLPRRMIVPR